MKLYIYNINNKNEYIASEEVEITNEAEIVPPYTAVPVPAAIAGKCWCFDDMDNAWTHTVDDHRGKTIYNSANSLITEKVKFVGDVKDGFTLVAPPDTDKAYCFNGTSWDVIIIPKIFTKLAIRRACRNLGLESKLDALLASNELFKKDWDDAQEINLADSITSQALRTNAFTDAEYDAVIEELLK